MFKKHWFLHRILTKSACNIQPAYNAIQVNSDKRQNNLMNGKKPNKANTSPINHLSHNTIAKRIKAKFTPFRALTDTLQQFPCMITVRYWQFTPAKQIG